MDGDAHLVFMKGSPEKNPAGGADKKRSRVRAGSRKFHPFQKVLVPTDFSTASFTAIEQALALAAQPGTTLLLVHALDPGSFAQSVETIPGLPDVETRAQDAQKDLSALARKRIPASIPVETLVRIGVPHDEIVRSAIACSADLIVIATQGRSGLKHILLGSTAERVVRHARCPVLVVRRGHGKEKL